jgi:hypothetical protein
MATWIARPFDYYGTAPNQILEDLTQANDNFEILGNCFVNNDPTTGIAKNSDQVDGFHASQTPAANTIPVADANGKIADGWLSDIPLVNARMSANQSIAAATWTKIAFNIVERGGNFDVLNYRFVVPVSGLYVVMASISLFLYGNSTSTNKMIRILVNESIIINEAANDTLAGAVTNVWTLAIVPLNVNDTISIYGYFGTGGSVLADKSWFQVFRLR